MSQTAAILFFTIFIICHVITFFFSFFSLPFFSFSFVQYEIMKLIFVIIKPRTVLFSDKHVYKFLDFLIINRIKKENFF